MTQLGIKEIASCITYPLFRIFTSSITTHTIPKQWKEARVSAIHKKGDKKLACNYRPVSITSIIAEPWKQLLETIYLNL